MVPGAPNLVSAVASVDDPGQVTVTWTNGADADSHMVQWKTANRGYTEDAAWSADDATSPYTTPALALDTEFMFRVVAENTDGKTNSNEVEVTTPAAAAAPEPLPPPGKPRLAAAAGTTDEVDVAWDGVAGAMGYKVEWREEDTVWYNSNTIDLDEADTTTSQYSYRFEIDAGVKTFFRLRTRNSAGEYGAASEESSITLPTAAPMAGPKPTNVRVWPINRKEFYIEWDYKGEDGTTAIGFDVGFTEAEGPSSRTVWHRRR